MHITIQTSNDSLRLLLIEKLELNRQVTKVCWVIVFRKRFSKIYCRKADTHHVISLEDMYRWFNHLYLHFLESKERRLVKSIVLIEFAWDLNFLTLKFNLVAEEATVHLQHTTRNMYKRGYMVNVCIFHIKSPCHMQIEWVGQSTYHIRRTFLMPNAK